MSLPLPERPTRRARPVYLTDDETVCLDRAAKTMGLKRGPFLRAVALYRAGWQGYSGPLFDLGADVTELQRHQAGDVLHETLRTLRELVTTCTYLYNRQRRSPDPQLLRMVVAYSKVVVTFADRLGELQRFDDSLQLAFDLETLANRLDVHNPITAGQLREAVELVLEALQLERETDGQGQQG